MDFARRLVPTAIRRRYAVKFGIALLILGISVALIGYVATAAISDQVENRVETDHASSASQEAQSLQMWNEQNEHTTEMIARSDVVASDDPAAIQQRYLDWKEHLDTDTFDISYVNLDDGTVSASTNESLRGASTSELNNIPSEAFSQASQTAPWVSSGYISQGEFGQDTTVVTYVQLSAENENRAIVYTANIEAYSDSFQNEGGVTTMVVDGNNEVILDNQDYGGEHEALGLNYSNVGLLKSARTEGATTYQLESSSLSFVDDVYGFGNDGHSEYVTSSARVFGTDWVVVTHEPASQALGYVNNIREWGILATILGVFMVGMVGAVLGRNTATSIDRLTEKASQMEQGNLNVDLETERIDNIGRLYNGFDSMRDTLRKQIEDAEAARQEAERERERVQELNDHLEDKAAEYCAVMGRAADGDLTARASVESENEQMQQIGEDFNQMLEEIEETIAELNRFATDVATASEQVTASSEEVRSASQQVTESVQEISDGADRQNESLQSVNQEMSGLSTTTEEIAASSNEVADIAERTVDTGREGQEAAQEAIAAMDEIETEAGSAVAEMRRLEEEVQQIDELINSISEIARQTNMLALNANIEASRSAGGSSDDEGFAVVAKEVKALSEDVAEAADEAEDRLEAIRERTEESAAEVEGTSSNIEDASDQVQEAVTALEEIAELAQETNVGVQEISAATEEQAASTQEVVSMVDGAATISEETTAEAENVAAAAEEQTTALTEVTKSASSLSQQAAQLSEALDRFDTDVDRDDVSFTSSFDVDEELAVGEPEFDGDDAAEETGDQGQGITFDTDGDADQADSDGTLAFDDDQTDDALAFGSGETVDDSTGPVNDESEEGAADPFESEMATDDETEYDAMKTPTSEGQNGDRDDLEGGLSADEILDLEDSDDGAAAGVGDADGTDGRAGDDPDAEVDPVNDGVDAGSTGDATREFDPGSEQTEDSDGAPDSDETDSPSFELVDDDGNEDSVAAPEFTDEREPDSFDDVDEDRDDSADDESPAEIDLDRDDAAAVSDADDANDANDADDEVDGEDVFTFGATSDDE
ncbi:methyl-accepting chemotaxis protein [Natrinema halophilum]|uniref:HAMP domain-containing protein n=1 Tax=Natrinema halophilum TaxID=1699371 RepID=A0A7D5L3D9_9EURY|nr:methyl-accepting chemotaxis protein [Natrinema halophilum]QLG49225.1 methyl-accepting chemotaxis protein [Natrinema halophilum]